MFSKALNRFRLISATEGLSFLLLVFIAMPIKYIGGNPHLVKIFGMFHGILFIIFMFCLFDAKKEESWHTSFIFKLFILSLIPFGAILIEKRVNTNE